MMVYATEGYAKRHGISESEAFSIFKKYNINNYFRKYYGVLHTQDFDEDVFFAEEQRKVFCKEQIGPVANDRTREAIA